MSGVIVSEYSENYNHCEARESLSDFLKRERIPALTGIDTRSLTHHIRTHGAIPAKIIFEHISDTLTFEDPNERLLAYEVSTQEVIPYKSLTPIAKTLLVVDMGVKNNMLRHFLAL